MALKQTTALLQNGFVESVVREEAILVQLQIMNIMNYVKSLIKNESVVEWYTQ